MRLLVALSLILMLSGCKSAQVHSMARTARIADLRFSDEYTDASATCIALAPAGRDGWAVYDECMERWQSAYAAIRILFASTYALDVARGRDEFRKAGCRWYRSLQVVDATSPVKLPAVRTGIESRWRRRCKSSN